MRCAKESSTRHSRYKNGDQALLLHRQPPHNSMGHNRFLHRSCDSSSHLGLEGQGHRRKSNSLLRQPVPVQVWQQGKLHFHSLFLCTKKQEISHYSKHQTNQSRIQQRPHWIKRQRHLRTWCSIEDRNPLRCRKRYTDHFPLNLRHAGIRPNRYIQF